MNRVTAVRAPPTTPRALSVTIVVVNTRSRLLLGPSAQEFQVFGFARSKMTDAEFRELIASTLTCRVSARCVRHRHAAP